MLAPLRFGAGVKGKVLDAYAHHLPVVGTSIAWEGLTDTSMDLNNLLNQCKDLYTTPIVWQKNVQDTLKLFKDKFDSSTINLAVQNDFFKVYNNLTQHRNQNYWQKILLQNQLNATKFMSKWIEEKNKK
jgi:hypothetical protein